jgi:hypothetical protein
LAIFCNIASIAIARMSIPESNIQGNVFNHHFDGSRTKWFKLHNDTRGIGELDFFDNP